MTDREELLAIKPVVRKARAGWLAISEPKSSLGIGVIGRSEKDAIMRFDVELNKWADLLFPKATT